MTYIYSYKGYTLQNELVSGNVEAKSKLEAMGNIRGVKRITECKLSGIEFGNHGVNKLKLSMFFGQLSYLLDSGIPLHKAIACLSESGDKDTKSISDKIYVDVSIGKAFSEAFHNLGGNLAERFWPQLEAAERGANLEQTLKEISIQLKKENKTARGIKTAMVYPGFILCMALGIAAFLLTSVVPDIAGILYELGGTLPYLTRLLMAMSEFVTQWGIIILAVMFVSIYLFYKFIRGKGRLWWDGVMLKTPLMGDMIRNQEQVNFYRSLYYMINSGLAFVPALEYSIATIENRRFRTDMEHCAVRVRQEGIDLGAAMSTIKYIDAIQLQAIKVGIEANRLQQTLYDTAENLEEINDEVTERFKAMLNPLLMIVVGCICGFIMFAMYLPMFTVMGNI